ncbi:hypothetical protein Tcan_03549 [Toxocara canis]|uniref:Transmembrane protein n=1 Tax=Toxocara canis TaxID=6265 RepID=A0A0B2UYN5_TOXCA|nr:hypothetical protein Tcan_03549 [Toxocara canis]
MASGVFALITAMHAIFLRYPNRVDFVLQCCSTIIAFTLLISSATETFCTITYEDDLQESSTSLTAGICYGLWYRTSGHRRSCDEFLELLHKSLASKVGIALHLKSSTSLTAGICYGLWYRTSGHRRSCDEFLELLHKSLASKVGIALHLSSLRFAISLSITSLATVHFATCIALAFYSAVETCLHIRSYHLQLCVIAVLLPAAIYHHAYCCTYFFFWPGIAVLAYAIVQSALSWKFECQGGVIRALNVLGAAIGMALVAAASFGIFCTATRMATNSFAFQWHCRWPISQYEYCYRVIDFLEPYKQWPKENVIAETAAVQIAVSIWLCLCGLAQFFLSLKSTFSTEVFL